MECYAAALFFVALSPLGLILSSFRFFFAAAAPSPSPVSVEGGPCQKKAKLGRLLLARSRCSTVGFPDEWPGWCAPFPAGCAKRMRLGPFDGRPPARHGPWPPAKSASAEAQLAAAPWANPCGHGCASCTPSTGLRSQLNHLRVSFFVRVVVRYPPAGENLTCRRIEWRSQNGRAHFALTRGCIFQTTLHQASMRTRGSL